MPKLHDIFLTKDPKLNRSHVVEELLQREHLNINEQDEQGDTILHLMVKHMFFNYYNPYMEGPFQTNICQSKKDYNGPGFLDDLEHLLALGANPTIKNNNKISPIELTFDTPAVWNWLGSRHLNRYFSLIQKYYPDSSSLIKVIEHGAYRSNEQYRKKTLIGFSYWVDSWINESLPKVLDERYLSLDCLTKLIQWINKGCLKDLGATDEIISKIYNRLIAQKNIQTTSPFLLDGVEALTSTKHRTIIIRGMLLNEPKCPIYDYVEQLCMLDLINLLTKELNTNFEELLAEYNQKYTLLKEIKAYPEPLNLEELTLLMSISETLDTTLNNKIMQGAHRNFDVCSGSFEQKKFMETRWGLFKKTQANHQKVIEELNNRYLSLQ